MVQFLSGAIVVRKLVPLAWGLRDAIMLLKGCVRVGGVGGWVGGQDGRHRLHAMVAGLRCEL